MSKPVVGTVSDERRVRRRDRWTFILLLTGCWVLFAAIEQEPFVLQGAVVESLVERGRMHFIHGGMRGTVFVNLDTNTPSFRYLFNIFPHGDVYRVNHAPGQFLLAAPWYAACVKLGWRFETHEGLVWRILVWTLTAPLGALSVACLFTLARGWGVPWTGAFLASLALSLCSPWWPASGVLYHDSLAVALILIGATMWQRLTQRHGVGAAMGLIAAGVMLAFAVVTTYLVAPLVLLIAAAMLASRPPRRDAMLLVAGFLPTLAILPLANMLAYGSPLATGYSAGGFDDNYPAPFDLANAWEKVGFYLWDPEYGLAELFPVFVLGAAGLWLAGRLQPRVRALLGALAVVQFLFIISMRHHGSVGWGMGRFFLPLYSILALGLPALWDLSGFKGTAARALLMAAMVYSFFFALAGAWYGVHGVMEPGLPTLKLRLLVEHPQGYLMLPWVAIGAGVLAEALHRACCDRRLAAAGKPSGQRRRDASQRSRSASAAGARPQRRGK